MHNPMDSVAKKACVEGSGSRVKMVNGEKKGGSYIPLATIKTNLKTNLLQYLSIHFPVKWR